MPSFPLYYRDAFDPAKNRTVPLIEEGEYFFAQDLNEGLSAERHARRGIADALFRDGDVVRGGQILVDKITGETSVEAGQIYVQGALRNLAAAVMDIPVAGEVFVGVVIETRVITSVEDPDLKGVNFPTRALDAHGLPRASWLEEKPRWGSSAETLVDTPTVGYRFFAVYTVRDGVVVDTSPVTDASAFVSVVERYDRESNGHYVARGCGLTYIDTTDGAQIYSLGEGVVNVDGRKIDRPSSVRMTYVEDPDLQRINAEPHLFTDGGSGTLIITLNRTPIQTIHDVSVLTEKTVTVTRGQSSGGRDPLPDAQIQQIMEVKQGGTTYVAVTSYNRLGDEVDWSPAGPEPAPGTTYNVTYRYKQSIAPDAQTATTVTVSGAVTGSEVDIDYSWKMPRFDLVAVDRANAVHRIKGVASPYSPQRPALPAGLLELAEIEQRWTDGYEGTGGLQKIVAMLQVMRNQAGTSGEAATYLGNVLNKMYSADTAKKFKGFGLDLPKALDKAKKEGKDLFEVFLDMTQIATKGDLSKLPLLFTDAEMQKGVRALMTQRDLYNELMRGLGHVDGTSMRDFRQVVGDTQGSVERLADSWDRLWTKIGQRVSKKAVPIMEAVSDAMDEADARARGTEKTVGDDRASEAEQIAEFKKRFAEGRDKNKKPVIGDDLAAYRNALKDVAEGRAESVMDYFKPMDLAKERAKYYQDGYVPGRVPTLEAETKYPHAVNQAETFKDKRAGKEYPLLTDRVPHPSSRSEADQDKKDAAALQKWKERYADGDGREFVTDENRTKARKWSMDENRERIERETEGLRSGNWRRFFFGDAADPNFDAREHFGVETTPGGADRIEGGAGQDELSGGAGGDAMPRGTEESLHERQMRVQYAYPYDRNRVDPEGADMASKVEPAAVDEAAFMQSLRRLFLGAAADPNFDAREHFGVETKAGGNDRIGGGAGRDPLSGSVGGDAVPRGATEAGSRSVTIEGTPTVVTQPSGVQQVQVMNAVRPNVTVNLSAVIQQVADPMALARQIGDAVGAEVSAAQQGGGDSGL